ncbi:MAG: hypothetical protein KF915_17345 [Polyangiaceae bacterium]|nr:hypothetical protein [Polyangiaceae bacterium]
MVDADGAPPGASPEGHPTSSAFPRGGLLMTLGALALLIGCGASWEVGEGHYRDARYADALVALKETEPDYAELEPDERARYALYRGLSHLAVGDATRADGWLRLAKQASDRDPALLSVDERGRLEAAWRSLGRMPGSGAFGPAWRAAEHPP